MKVVKSGDKWIMRYWTILVEMMKMGPKVKTCQTEKGSNPVEVEKCLGVV